MRAWLPASVLVLATLSASAAGPTAAAVDPDLLAGLAARSIGPAGMSGRIAAIAGVAADPRVLYVGAATGGVWKSTNGGLTFTPVFDEQPTAAAGALAVFGRDQVVWVGTGESNVRNSASAGNGVYRSLDGGKTWAHLGLDATERISRIVLHPSDPDTAWVAAMGREWGENAERGVYRTTDGGRTWSRVLFVDERTGAADLAIDPSNPNVLLAAMWQYRRWPYFFRSGGPSSGLYASRDGGATWRRLEEEDGLPKGPLGRIGVAFSPSRPNVVYALVEAEKSALVRSDDGGRSWRTVNDEANVAPRPFYYADIAVDPEWPSRVYSLDYSVRVSDDGGRSFRALGGSRQAHGDVHAIWFDPADAEHFWFGDDGGVYETRDRGETFRFVSTLPLAQYYHVSVDMERPFNILGGMQDNSSWRGPSTSWTKAGIRSHSWDLVGYGDGFDTLADPEDPEQGYSMLQGGELMRWNLRTGERRSLKPAPPSADVTLRFNWNAGLAQDPFDPATIYYGSQLVHRSADRGETWTAISGDLTTNRPEWQQQRHTGGLTPDVTAAENFCTIVAIAPSPLARGLLWVGSDDGRIHVTRDGGASWASVESGLKGVAPAGAWVAHIRPSRFEEGEAFVVLDAHRDSDFRTYVARTTDFGRTWRSLTTPELRGWALAIEQDPVRRELLFLGTETGLYVSLDTGARWLPFRHGVPTVAVSDLVVHPRDHDLVIATHGRALYVLDDVRPLRELSVAVLAKPLHVFPAAPAQQYWRRAEPSGFGLGAGEFRGADRPYGALVTFSLDQPGLPLPDDDREKERKAKERAGKAAGFVWAPERHVSARDAKDGKDPDEGPKATVEVRDASGAVVRTFKAPARLGLNRAVWDLGADPFKRYPREREDDDEDDERSGPEVAPGAYTVTISFGGHRASTTVDVIQDPETSNTAADWQRRRDAIRRAGALNDTAVEAAERLRAVRAGIEAVVERRKAALAREKAKAGERREEGGGAEADELVEAARTLLDRITEVERTLWTPPGTVGIVDREHVAGAIGRAQRALASSWAPPSPNQLAFLRLAEQKLAAFLPELNTLFAEVEPFRARAEAAGLGLLAPRAALAMP